MNRKRESIILAMALSAALCILLNPLLCQTLHREKSLSDSRMDPGAGREYGLSAPPPSAMRYRGEHTMLSISTDISRMRHDGPDCGSTSLSLSSSSGTILFKRQMPDNFFCLGYSPARHAFVLKTLGEVVSTLKVVAFEYLPENKPDIIYSKSFTSRYVAPDQGIIPSPTVRFIAFVGRKVECDTWRLYVLDTRLDTIRSLGKAPQPPPFSKDEHEAVQDMIQPGSGQHESAFWSWDMMHSSATLEPTICRFVTPNVLRVSYGKDTCFRRSKRRIARDFVL